MGKWLENWYCWFLIRWKEGNSYFLYVPIFLVGKILFWKEALEGKSMGKWLENWLRLVVSLGVAIIFWMAKIDVLSGPTQTWDEFQVFLGNFAFGPKVCATSHAPAGARGLRRALSGNHLWYHGMDDFRKFHVGNCMELYIYILYIIYIYIYIFSIIYIYVYYILCYLYIYIYMIMFIERNPAKSGWTPGWGPPGWAARRGFCGCLGRCLAADLGGCRWRCGQDVPGKQSLKQDRRRKTYEKTCHCLSN